ncbi:hypothetical protein [Thermaurantiacus sp.]
MGRRQAFGRLSLILLAALVASCAGEPAERARFPLADCRVAAVRDAKSGAAIAGIEDIALAQNQLILSAHDRLAVRRARPGEAVPEGGLWTLPLAGLAGPAPAAVRLLPEGSVAGGLRPHGLAAEGRRLAVVNRRMRPDGRLDPVVLELDLSGPRARVGAILRGPGFCALNDVAFWQGEVLATRDRNRCPRSLLGELFVRADSGSLLALGDAGARVLADGLAFANGVAVLPDGTIAVAETRGRRVRLSNGRQLAVPGHPDNLTVSEDGMLVVGVIPSLWRFGLHLLGQRARAPARVVALDPASGAVTWLFDDPEGRLLPGVTVALLADGMLVAGAVRAPGLLVCGRRA